MSPSRPTAPAMLVIAGSAAVSFAFALSGLQQGGYSATFFPKDPAPAHAAIVWFSQYGWPALMLLGALAIGFVGDRARRGAAIAASFVLLSAGFLGLSFLPSYEAIGAASSTGYFLCLGVSRLGSGGAMGLLIAYVVEAAPAADRGLHVGYLQAAALLGNWIATLGYGLVYQAAGPNALSRGIWIALLQAALALLPLAWFLRNAVTPTDATPPPARSSWGKVAVFGILALTGAGMLAAVELMMVFPVITQVVQQQPTLALLNGAVMAVVAIACTLLGGWLSDRYGRRPVMLGFSVILLLLFIPVMYWLGSARTPFAVIAGPALIVALTSLWQPTLLTLLAEALPQRLRAAGIGAIRATPPILIAFIIGRGGRSVTNGEMVLFGLICVAGVWALFGLPETAPVKAKAQEISDGA